MAKATRNYSDKTLKLIFGLSGNRCAFPTCTKSLIEDGTEISEATVTGNICHIYAASDNGPRGKPGLKKNERNAPNNLILMCRDHHAIVDGQWKDYPATQLLEWKAKHESQYKQGSSEAIQRQGEMQQLAYLTEISDQQINSALARIIQARHLNGFMLDNEVANLAHRIEKAELLISAKRTKVFFCASNS
ncbi:MAG: HNH endonuclease, partial [Pseudomonadota bacterium]